MRKQTLAWVFKTNSYEITSVSTATHLRKLNLEFLNKISWADLFVLNCVGSARQAVVQKWAKFSWWQKKCHIWLMPYATNFDGCSLINPAEMRQSCPSIRDKGVHKIAWKNPLLHRFHKAKILDCYQAAHKIFWNVFFSLLFENFDIS